MAGKHSGTDKRAKLRIDMLREIMRIRMIEERIADIYPRGEMRTPTHFSIGQEAISVGVCSRLKDSDSVFASHRCHAAYLARGGDLKAMLAELFGRATGVCKGRSGSAHLASPERNMYSAPIVGAMIPVAVGAALSYAMDNKKNVAAAFFGDAAPEEGAFFESINFAVVKRLPVLFVCENNLFSTHTHLRYRQPDIPIYKRVKAFGLPAAKIDGNDALKVYDTAGVFIDSIRKGQGPVFLECMTYRFREHVGPNYDFENPYRRRAEVEYMMSRRCPLQRLKRQLLKDATISDKDIESMQRKIGKEIDAAVRYARVSPWPSRKDLLKDVY